MKAEEKNKLISEIGKPLLLPITYIQLICLLAIISLPFVFMWHSWSLAWRISLSGLIGILIFHALSKIVKQVCNEAIDKELNEGSLKTPKKSRFQQKMEEAMQNAEVSKIKA